VFEGQEVGPAIQAMFDATVPERVVPAVVYLASRECELNHHYLSAATGRFARVFVGLGSGWASDAPTVEDVAAHVGEIVATDPYLVPDSVADEVAALQRAGRMG
jgi:hypothetical protein